MTWANVYLVCFLVGFTFSLLSALAGTLHVHLPHLDLHHGLHLHVGHGGHAGVGRSGAPMINLGTIAAFLAWFGGTGYLLTEYSTLWFLTALGVASASGLVGAALVFWFLAKVLIAHERPLDPEDYRMAGVLGHVTSGIRPSGMGEMMYTQDGARHSVAVRSEDGTAIAKGTEVVVTRYEKGIAFVRRWDELTGAGGDPSGKNDTSQGAQA